MEYRGIRYTIRTGIERWQLFVVIHPEGVKEVSSNKIFGVREDADAYARQCSVACPGVVITAPLPLLTEFAARRKRESK
jgi:hypothetical protein